MFCPSGSDVCDSGLHVYGDEHHLHRHPVGDWGKYSGRTLTDIRAAEQ